MKIIEWFQNNFSKVKITDKMFLLNYAASVAFISSIVTIVSFFVTAKDTCIGGKGCLILFCVLLFLVFIVKYWKANHEVDAKLEINETNIEIINGDIFKGFDEPKTDELFVIPANEYFDDIVDNRIVSDVTLHGMYILRMKKANKLAELQKTIKTDPIINKKNNYKDVKRESGNTRKYNLGSLVKFESYVLAAFTEFDNDNKAELDAEKYLSFLIRFWKNIDLIYAGRTINVPLLGAGITRFKDGKPSKQQLLEMMIWSFKLSGFRITYKNKAVRFLIYKDDMPEIDFYHIQHNSSFH